MSVIHTLRSDVKTWDLNCCRGVKGLGGNPTSVRLVQQLKTSDSNTLRMLPLNDDIAYRNMKFKRWPNHFSDVNPRRVDRLLEVKVYS